MNSTRRRLSAAACAVAALIVAGCSKSGGNPQPAPASSAEQPSPTTSAESTAQPAPPEGFSAVASPPAGFDPSNWGDQIQLAAEPDGSLVLVFTAEDLNHDGNAQDGELLVSRRDPATGAWSAPAAIFTGTVEPTDGRSIALAEDPTSGALALALASASGDDKGGVFLLWSTDRGATWKTVTVAAGSYPALPSVALDGQQLAVAFVNQDTIHVATAPVAGSAPGTFAIADAPGLADQAPRKWQPAVTLVGGHPLIAYYVPDGDSNDLVTWDGTSAAPAKVYGSAGTSDDDAYTALTASGGTLVLASTLRRSDKDDGPVATVLTSADGASWSAPAPVPADGGSAPFDLALTLIGPAAALAYVPNSSGGEHQCGSVKVPASADLVTWSACALPAGDAGAIQDTNWYPALVTGPDGTTYLAFTVHDATDTIPTGVLVRTLAKGAVTH